MTKVSDLSALTGVNVDPTADLLLIIDASLSGIARDKNITINELGIALAETIRDTIGATLVQGAGITVTVDDAGNTITIAAAAPSIQAVASAATVTPTFSDDLVKITAQAAGLILANPTGTAVPGRGLAIRIKDNGTARAITYGSQYRPIGVTLPTTTVVGKTLYLGLIYNSDDTKWDVVAVAQEA